MILIEGYIANDQTMPRERDRRAGVQAWEEFEAGKLEAAASALVDREQPELIQDDSDEPWAEGLAVQTFLTAASFVSASDPFGGESFYEHRIRPEVTTQIPIPFWTGQPFQPFGERNLLPFPISFDGRSRPRRNDTG